jgi:hypothetical protein
MFSFWLMMMMMMIIIMLMTNSIKFPIQFLHSNNGNSNNSSKNIAVAEDELLLRDQTIDIQTKLKVLVIKSNDEQFQL